MSTRVITRTGKTVTPIHAALPILVTAIANLWPQAFAREIDLYQGDSFKTAVESLEPGDLVTVYPGSYEDIGRIDITVKGTRFAPVVIAAAPGEVRPFITRPRGGPPQNTINIDGAEFLRIRGLEISSNGGDGIRLEAEPSNIVLEDLVIHDVNVGINFRSDMHHIIVRRNEIYNTNDTGEAMYVGCNNAKCSVSESIIEDNWIHDTLLADQGDGIEIKNGSHSNLIRNNVIHDTNYPCILVYGSNGHPRNVVEGNVMWNCGNSGIQAAADAVIRNNIVFDSPYNGFNSQPHQGVQPVNLEFIHNTIIGGESCVRLAGWNDSRRLVFANNAIYCPTGELKIDGLSGVAVSGNVVFPKNALFRGSANAVGHSVASDFVDAPSRNAYPADTSTLLDAGDPSYTTFLDFNGLPRESRADAGAYAHRTTRNPGWKVRAGFKETAQDVEIRFEADPAVVERGASTTLSWNASNVDSCEGDGNWDGPRMLSGSETVGPVMTDSLFELVCEGELGIEVRMATVLVGDAPARPAASDDGGALGPLLLFALLLVTMPARAVRQRRFVDRR